MLYTRESAAQVYSTFAYWAANAVVSIPLLLIAHLVFVEIAYWLTGLYPGWDEHLFALLVTFLNNLISFYTAQFMAAISPSAEVRAVPSRPLTRCVHAKLITHTQHDRWP